MSVDFAPMNETYVRSTAIAEAPITAACTHCKSPRGIQCQSSGGWPCPTHATRNRAIAHLSDDERYDAVMELRRETAGRRAEALSVLDRLSA